MIYKKKVKPNWNNIHIIQEQLGKMLKNYELGYIDSVKMVTGEFLENSVKYYMNKGICKKIEFYFSNDDGVLISIKNQDIEVEDLSPLVELIDKINSNPNPNDLYIDRLKEILDNRVKGESKLGLLRVVSDGGYSLSYNLNNDKLNISAVKNAVGDKMHMKKLVYEDLTIEVNDIGDYIDVAWIGKCRTLNPEHILDTYLKKVSEFVKGKKVIVSFEQLDSMNSSTIPPLLTFIKDLEESSTDATFLYNDEKDWQRASFKPLSIIAGRYKNIVIKPTS